MVYCGDKHYDSFEELGDAILASLPKKRLPVRWWKGHKVVVCRHSNHLRMSLWGRIKTWLPHFSTSRSVVGFFWLHTFLFNRWDIMFVCGIDGRSKEKEAKS